jgi:methylated-DNA-[protein]-cysteine S-methyltransferase
MTATSQPALAQMTFDSPIGRLRLTSNGHGLTAVSLDDPPNGESADERSDGDPLLIEAREQLEAYFDLRLMRFDLPLAPRGTEFQQRVWDVLRAVPFGETISYAELARRVGKPKAMRAVGAANGRNPLMIVVPCHRVIGADGSLTGFGGGIERKRWLIDHESAVRLSDE